MSLRSARRPLLLCSALAALLHVHAGCDSSPPADPSAQLWEKQLGTTQDDSLLAVAASSSVVYAAGSTLGRLPDFVGTTQPPDGYVVKIDPSGQLGWQKQLGTSAYDEWRGVAVDSGGNAIVVGYTAGQYDGQIKIGGDSDAVIARIRPDGTVDWMRQFGTLGADYLLAVTVDSAGNAYAAGWTSGTFAGQTLNGTSDAFVVKYRSDGTQEYLVQFGCPKEDSLSGITLDSSGALYVSGWATDVVAAGQQAYGNRDGAIYKLQPGTGVVWARQFGSSDDDEAAAITLSGGTLYAVGRTLGTLPGQATSGRIDGMVASYDTSGTQRWLRQFGTAGDDELRGVAAASDGSGVYVGGYVSRALPTAQWSGQQDAFFTKLRSDGSQDWVKQFGTAFNDQLNALVNVGTGSLYAVGTAGDALLGQVRVGGIDAFAARYTVP